MKLTIKFRNFVFPRRNCNCSSDFSL